MLPQNAFVDILWLTSVAVSTQSVNTLKPRQNGRHFADDIFKCIFLNENVWIPIKFSMKFVPKGPINSIGADNGLAPDRRQAIVWNNAG